jgi:ketosteroid isomerase-like protein
MSPIRMERLESGVRVVIAFNEAFNRHDLPAMLELISDDCVLESYAPAPDGVRYTGKEAVARFWQELFTRAPDAHLKVEDVFGFGHRVVMLWRYDWTDESGNHRHLHGVDISREQDGTLHEKLLYGKG